MNDESPEALVDALAGVSGVPAPEAEEIKKVCRGADSVAIPAKLTTESGPGEAETSDLRVILAGMTVPQKIKLALFGNAVCRAILIGDPNRMIREFVLRNPQLQEREVVEYTRNPQIDEGILRAIAESRKWTKSYAVKINLVTNPKTPPDLSLKWLRFLNEGDLKKLAKSKNVPNLVAVTARKRLEAKS